MGRDDDVYRTNAEQEWQDRHDEVKINSAHKRSRDDSAISSSSYSSGTTPAGLNFDTAYPEFHEQVIRPLQQFGKKVFGRSFAAFHDFTEG